MARFLSILLWTGVFLLILLTIDQLLVRVPASQPTHAAIAAFYRDLRGRLLDLATTNIPPGSPAGSKQPALPSKAPAPKKTPPASIESVIEQRQTQKPAAAAAPRTQSTPPAPVAAQPPATALAPDSIEAVIEQREPAPVKTKAAPARPVPVETTRRYLYADEQGNLHFAATLAEVPERYRSQAKLVGE
jgi:glucose/arabinose dehydrogenase